MAYEHKKHDGSYPSWRQHVPQSAWRPGDGQARARALDGREKQSCWKRLADFHARNAGTGGALAKLRTAMGGGNVFGELMEAAQVCSPGDHECAVRVGGQYRRSRNLPCNRRSRGGLNPRARRSRRLMRVAQLCRCLKHCEQPIDGRQSCAMRIRRPSAISSTTAVKFSASAPEDGQADAVVDDRRDRTLVKRRRRADVPDPQLTFGVGVFRRWTCCGRRKCHLHRPRGHNWERSAAGACTGRAAHGQA